MNKIELINEISTQAKMSRPQAKAAIDAAIKVIGNALAKGDKVSIVGLGTFMVREKPAHTGRNPITKETIQIPAKNTIRFKPGALLGKKVQ